MAADEASAEQAAKENPGAAAGSSISANKDQSKHWQALLRASISHCAGW